MSFNPGPVNSSVHTNSDVALNNLVDGNTLFYSTSSGKWVNQAGTPVYLTWNGSDYIPTALKAITSRGKIFTGPTDPSTVSGVTLSTYDTWNQTS